MRVGLRGCEMRGMRGMRGFSVIEILVVVVILGIAAAVAVPMMNQDSVRVPAAARIVASDLTYAQNVASTRQQRIYVLFQSSGGAITGYHVAFTQTPAANTDYVVRPGDVSPMKTMFGSAATGSNGPLTSCQIVSAKTGTTDITKMCFDAMGQPMYYNGTDYVNLATAGNIRITNLKGTFTMDVSIQPLTGVVSAQ